uniref:Uncharacterized protein n=1 Tax=Anguilla anguilla TaxID=7936 RepID=A0A0E9RP95_ANGAN
MADFMQTMLLRQNFSVK